MSIDGLINEGYDTACGATTMAGSEAAKISDYYCEICKDLWLEPVTLPCRHTMCKECYFQNEAANPLQCPFCKKSVRTWTRKAKKDKKYVGRSVYIRQSVVGSVVTSAHVFSRTSMYM